MKKIEIFDPAMCCPTGLCGTNINPELMRIAVVVETLKRQGVIVIRHNLRDEPQVYVSNKTVNEYYEKNTIKVDDIVDKPQPTATFDINNNIFDNIGD